MNSSNKKQVVVFVHDAGGAEVIGAYIRSRLRKELFHAYGAGPAARVFKRLGLPLRKIADDRDAIEAAVSRHANASFALLAAPGWMTQIEIRALRAVKKAGIKAIIYMDSWTDARKRFGYPEKGWQQHDPDEFWVGDEYALELIRTHYPHVPARLVPNRYFINEKKRYKELKRTGIQSDAILFTSTIGGKSHELLAELLERAEHHASEIRLRIRYHPGDVHGRYAGLLKSCKGKVEIEISHEADLVKDLLRARVVVGVETTAMAIAVLCGIKTVSFVKKGDSEIIPFPSLKRFRSARETAEAAICDAFGKIK